MKRFIVQGEIKTSSILVGESLKNIARYLPSDKPIVIITDENINRLYGKLFPNAPAIIMGLGEESKTLATAEYLCRQLIEIGCDRSWFVLGIGGGIVCDVTGFVASIFLRGISFGFVSTSLLSQVDASVGGKNGVNLDGYKNMVGVFNQPKFVICDINMLQTLPLMEISNGLAEIVKHGLIADKKMLDFIAQYSQEALVLNYEVICRLISDSIRIKSSIVQADEHEAGERRKLNFGHTIGHAIEKLEQKGHGRAVAMGIHAAALFSMEYGFISRQEVDWITNLLERLNLPTTLTYPADQIISAVAIDKKKQSNHIYFIFLESLGKVRIEKISYKEINSFIKSVFQ